MSLLTRTKGYFVVICVLMVAFLGTFSWRLLHSSYDPSILPKHPSSIPRVDKVRRFQDERPGEDSVKREKSLSKVDMDTDEKAGSEVDIDINAKDEKSGKVKTKDDRLGSRQEDESVKSQNRHVHRPVMVEDDQPRSVGSIVKLGHGSNEDEHYSNVLSRNHGDSSVSKVDARQGGMDSQSRGEKHYKSGASPSVDKSRESVEARDQVSDKGTNGTEPFTKDEISDLLAKIHELGLSATDVKEKLSSWKQGSNKSKTVSTNSVVMPPKISNKPNKLHSYLSDDDQTVVSPGKFRVVQLQSSSLGAKENNPNDKQSVINDFHVNSEGARTPLQSNEIPEGKPRNPEKPSHHGANTEVPSSNSDPLSRTELNRRQREKYLQLLKEKFRMSKAQNMSVETRKFRTDSQMFTEVPFYASQREDHRDSGSYVREEHKHSGLDNNEREHSDTGTERREDLARPDYSTVTRRYTKSMYETLRSKYPSFDTRDQEESHSTSEVTLRPDFCRGCFDFNFKTILDHPTLCKSSSRERSEPVFLLMLISSAPSNYHARTVIRQTWGAECRKPNSTLKCLFVIGLSKSSDENSRVQLENDHHQDILMFGFRDSYANLTYKTVTSFKWATQNCYSASYVMKTDDDMYVNSHLIPYMLQVAPRRKFMGGSCWGSSSPNRDTSSKWFVSLKSFHKPKFPPMCSGTGYIMSMDVLRSVLFASRNVPFFHLEDVYVALCLQKYGVLPVNIMGFSNMFQEFGACFYRNSVMTSHQVPPELLEDFWTSMNKCPEAHVSPSQLYIIMPYPETD